MIKAIILDFGGVMLRTEDHSHRRRWEAQLGLSPGEAEEIVFNSQVGQQAQRGEVSNEALWAWVGQRLDLGDQLEAFRHDFWAGDVLDVDMVSAVRALQTSYQTAMISNATDSLREDLETKHGIADAFDLIVISAEEHVMKPAPDIYERTLRKLGRGAEEAVFVDDFERNIKAASDLGMAVLHYRPGVDLVAELAALGIAVPGAKESER
jgi:epoxide hydrolase-like predicted phosphatase